MSMKGKIVFRVGSFPKMSETFVTLQIIQAIKLDYDVAIVVDKKGNLNDSSQSDLILKYDLLNKTIELIRHKSRWIRLLELARCIMNFPPIKFYRTFNYSKYGRDGLSGNIFFQLCELKSLLNVSLIHIMFGVNQFPFVPMKKSGLLKADLLVSFLGFDVHFNEDSFNDVKQRYVDLFQLGSKFIAITKYLEDQLIELGCPEDKLELNPLGINTDYFIPLLKPQNDISILISVGRLVKWKGHEYGIRAISKLKEKGQKVKYRIVGDGEEKNNLKKLIIDLNLTNDVILLGDKTQDEIRDELQKADVFLMTSTYDDTGRRETQGVVTGEAQACELAVVAFRSGGVPYTLIENKTGFLSEENDYKTMSTHIETLILDSKLRKKMGIDARQFVEKYYSMNILNEKWKKLYSILIKSN